ncbi:MAG: acetyl-CoA carboxylase carboxyltransferase subunit beta [Phycisphaeraceae bacterium]|nr:acetyl-CoA carboxylase carboxyltransferase subunit beta [Phycisphaeraceae bacterium]
MPQSGQVENSAAPPGSSTHAPGSGPAAGNAANPASPVAANPASSGNVPGGSPEPPAGPASPPADGPSRTWVNLKDTERKTEIAPGLWLRCPSCSAMLYRKSVENNLSVCPECDHHFRIDADERTRQLCDPGSFEPLWEDLKPVDPLEFVDLKPYARRLVDERNKSGHSDAVVCGKGFIKGRGVVLCCMNHRFMMGSMGSVVGEKIARAIDLALETDRPLVIVSCSGGARMQESALSLMQMAKTSAALARLDDAGGLFISILTDPTTGGVTASFAMLGDVILAEPKALIGFAGPRVIANTVRQALPEGFQTSEHLLSKGFVDRVVHRRDLRSEISRLIDYADK